MHKQVVGAERRAPSPLDVVRPASMSTDVLRSLRESMAALQGLGKTAPVSSDMVLSADARAGLVDLSNGVVCYMKRACLLSSHRYRVAWLALRSQEHIH